MTELVRTQTNRTAKVMGISFQPHIFERLEAESNKLERPNRSLIVERALRLYFATLDATNDQRREGAA